MKKKQRKRRTNEKKILQLSLGNNITNEQQNAPQESVSNNFNKTSISNHYDINSQYNETNIQNNETVLLNYDKIICISHPISKNNTKYFKKYMQENGLTYETVSIDSENNSSYKNAHLGKIFEYRNKYKNIA